MTATRPSPRRGRPAPLGLGREPQGPRRRIGLEPAELAILFAFVLVSTLPLALLAWQAVFDDRIWLGIDGGSVVQDQMQYVNWIRDASEHVLISNHYQAGPTEKSYLHPGALISAIPVSLGLAPAAGYLLWKPVAILALFFAVRAYVQRLLPAGPARWIALVLALFFLPPTALIAGDIGLTVASVETWPIDMLWGYFYSSLGIALLAVALLAYERDRSSGRVTAWPALLALTSTWLQPWEGPLLIGVILGAEAVLALYRRRSATAGRARTGGAERPLDRRRLLGLLAPLVAAVAVPLGYYVVLGRVDPSWSIDPGVHDFLDPPWWAIAVTIAPLAIPALLAYRRPPATFQDAAVRVWPVAALGLFWLLTTAYPGHYAPHALRGLSIPLAVLAVTGLGTLRLGRSRNAALAAAACGVIALTVPATVDKLEEADRRIDRNSGPYFLTRDERDALDYLDRADAPGAVYAPVSMGQLVPAETGRHTAVGNLFWTPDYLRRRAYTEILFRGRLAPAAARAIASASGSRFLLTGCDGRGDLSAALRPLLTSVRRFGCATVYELKA